MTRVLEAEVAFPAQCELAEGPVWDAARGCSGGWTSCPATCTRSIRSPARTPGSRLATRLAPSG